MRTTACLLAWLTLFSCVSAALGGDAKLKPILAPAYIEATNGLFSVCAYDHGDRVLLRYKGLYISRTNLPPVSIIRSAMIYAMGERPQIADPWHPKPEDIYIYGEIPYPVKDIAPRLELYRTREGDTFIGVLVRTRFHAVTNAGEAARTELHGVSVYESSGWQLHVIPATLPRHREKEIMTLIQSLRANE